MVICNKKDKNRCQISVRKIWSVTLINMQRWKNDQRIWMIFFFLGIFVFNELKGFTAYGLDAGERCTAYMLPVLFDSTIIGIGSMKTLLFLGGLILLCDAPFLYRNTPYVIIRSDRNCWWMGECCYILTASFIYVAFLAVVSAVTVLPVIQFGDGWGGVLERFVNGDADIRQLYHVHVSVPFATQGVLFPSGAQLYTFATVWIVLWILGMIQYVVNLVTKSMFWGLACAGIFVFLDPILNLLLSPGHYEWLQMLSPVSWVSTDLLHLVDNEKYLSMTYIVSMLMILSVLLLFIIRLVSKKIIIEIHREI